MIRPICDKCGEELKKFGAILLGPPKRKKKKYKVVKYHICVKCYKKLKKEFQ